MSCAQCLSAGHVAPESVTTRSFEWKSTVIDSHVTASWSFCTLITASATCCFNRFCSFIGLFTALPAHVSSQATSRAFRSDVPMPDISHEAAHASSLLRPPTNTVGRGARFRMSPTAGGDDQRIHIRALTGPRFVRPPIWGADDSFAFVCRHEKTGGSSERRLCLPAHFPAGSLLATPCPSACRFLSACCCIPSRFGLTCQLSFSSHIAQISFTQACSGQKATSTGNALLRGGSV